MGALETQLQRKSVAEAALRCFSAGGEVALRDFLRSVIRDADRLIEQTTRAIERLDLDSEESAMRAFAYTPPWKNEQIWPAFDNAQDRTDKLLELAAMINVPYIKIGRGCLVFVYFKESRYAQTHLMHEALAAVGMPGRYSGSGNCITGRYAIDLKGDVALLVEGEYHHHSSSGCWESESEEEDL